MDSDWRSVSWLTGFSGSLVLVSLSGWFSWLLATNATGDEVTSPVMTVIISMILGYIIITVFMSMITHTSETIMISYMLSIDLQNYIESH